MLAELRRSNEEYFLVTMPLLMELNDPRIWRFTRRQLGFPLAGRQAMQPDVIMPMIYFSSCKR